ncbi:ATP-binding protein [Campylobacter curvus]|uniref:ATP-binding protein n=1 Tax=Campylobacter curvus TaxID=200 RepID=UPI00146FD92E|nr:ATP-binding protein [Campylobacter curvus]
MNDLKAQFELYQKEGGSYRKLAEMLGIKSHTYVNLAINGWGDYKLSDEKKSEVEEMVANFFNSRQLKVSSKYDEICSKADILPFNNTIIVIASVIKAIRQRALMKISAKSGTGKTVALQAVMGVLPQSVMVTAYDGISKKELLEDIADIIEAKPLSRSSQHLMRAIKTQLAKSQRIIIIDEANFLGEKSLEQIRHIQDCTHAPIILAGTEKLDLQIARSHEQVATRIRNPSKKLSPFGGNEVIMLFEKYGITIGENDANAVWQKCKNLREVRYAIEDLIELYNGDASKLKEVLKEIQ